MTVELVVVVAELGAAGGMPSEARRAELTDALTRRLSAREQSLLAGDVTRGVRSEEADQPAARVRAGIAGLARDTRASHGDLVSLRISAVDLASLLVRAAGNAAAGGQASQAPELRSAAPETMLGTTAAELAAHAQEVERLVDERGDVAVHHLAAGLPVRVASETLHGLGTESTTGTADPALLDLTVAAG